MVTCSLGGAADLKLLGVRSELSNSRRSWLVMPCKMKCSRLELCVGLKEVQAVHGPTIAGFDTRSGRLSNALIVSCLADGKQNSAEPVKLEEKTSTVDQVVPGPLKVQSLLTAICDTTSIAEVELKIGGFHVYVKRDLAEKSIPALAPIQAPTPTPTNPLSPPPDPNGSATASSLAISKPNSLSGSIQSILESASDEGIVILQSPKVGFFRTSRTIKGKRAPPSCKEKQEVEEGQVLCYVEQLGGEMPIESDVSGEVVKILRTDGEPVGYGDALIAILPSFPGIKKLQ